MKYFLDTEFIEGTQVKSYLGGFLKIGQHKPTIDLISIGIVEQDKDAFSKRIGKSDRTYKGREYYAISKDFNLKEAWNRYDEKVNLDYKPDFGDHHEGVYNPKFIRTYWIRENVLRPIFEEMLEYERAYVYKAQNLGVAISSEIKDKFTYRRFKKLLKKYGRTNKQIATEIKQFTGVEFSYPDGIGSPDTANIEFYAYYADYDWVVFCWLFGKMIDLPKSFPMFCIDLKQILNKKALEALTRTRKLTEEKLSLKSAIKYIKQIDGYPKQEKEHNALDDAKWNKKLYEFLDTL